MNKKSINIGQKYSLDLGQQAPVIVEVIKFIDDESVLCKYLYSWEGRTEELSLEFFK